MPITKDQKELFDHCVECDGAEIPEPYFDDCKALEDAGLVSMSSRHGPGRQWVRITPTGKKLED